MEFQANVLLANRLVLATPSRCSNRMQANSPARSTWLSWLTCSIEWCAPTRLQGATYESCASKSGIVTRQASLSFQWAALFIMRTRKAQQPRSSSVKVKRVEFF